MAPPYPHPAGKNTTRRGVSLVKRTDKQTVTAANTSRLTHAYLQDASQIFFSLKIISLIIVAGMMILTYLLVTFNQIETRVFPTTENGRLVTPPPVDQPIDDNLVGLWIVDAITQATTFGFHDYDLRFAEFQHFFNDRGWDSFSRFTKMSFNGQPSLRSRLENDRLTLYTMPDLAPQILQRGLVNGVYTYIIRQTVIASMNSTSSANQAKWTIDLTVERVSGEVSASGLVISQWRFNFRN